jgi:hypothetical protein
MSRLEPGSEPCPQRIQSPNYTRVPKPTWAAIVSIATLRGRPQTKGCRKVLRIPRHVFADESAPEMGLLATIAPASDAQRLGMDRPVFPFAKGRGPKSACRLGDQLGLQILRVGPRSPATRREAAHCLSAAKRSVLPNGRQLRTTTVVTRYAAPDERRGSQWR